MKCPKYMSVYIAIFQAFTGLVLCLVGLIGPSWVDTTTGGGVGINYGLWKYCASGSCGSLPDSLENASVEASRAFGIMGVIAGTASVGLGAFFFFKKNPRTLLVAAVMTALAFLFCLIEFIVIVVEVDTSDFGYCYGTSLSGFIQFFSAAINYFVGRCKAEKCN